MWEQEVEHARPSSFHVIAVSKNSICVCRSSDHTVWVGAILLRLYFEPMGLRTTLVPLLLPIAKTSNNQIPADSYHGRPGSLVVKSGHLTSVICGQPTSVLTPDE
jgi:hypothetical protein